jgi:hypothetical protein
MIMHGLVNFKFRLVSCIIEMNLQDQTVRRNFPSFLILFKEIKNDRNRSVIKKVFFLISVSA